MRKFIWFLLGFASTLGGTLIVMPRINRRLWPAQLVLGEFSWLVTLIGLLAAFNRRGMTAGRAFGLYGAALSLKPLIQVPSALDDMDNMMREGLGHDYERCIPPQVMGKLSSSRWSLAVTFGARNRNSRASVLQDIPYNQTTTRLLKLDVYQPHIMPLVGERYPAIITLHGGGWSHGEKGSYFAPHHRYLTTQGYVVFDIQYRFTDPYGDGAKWPAQLEDVREAIRWVKEHAAAYNIDPQRIALLGRSAGGHLALEAAYRACEEYEDTRVRAVVSIYAPTDLRLTAQVTDSRVVSLLGDVSHKLPEVYADASPVEFARDNLPPTLLLHGYTDGLVTPIHGELLLNRLRATNTPCVYLRVPWSRHGFDFAMPGLGAQLTQYYMDRFLAWTLYGDLA